MAKGHHDAAAEGLTALERLIVDHNRKSARADVARLAGQLAEARGDEAGAIARYRDGVADVTDGALPLPLAQLNLAFGTLLRRSGERKLAIDRLRTAREILARLGAVPFLERCDAELTACGLRAPDTTNDLLALTSAEQTVAHLVASGLANREVASRLYVSTKAIEYHLGHIYDKLGIRSRRQLAELMSRPA